VTPIPRSRSKERKQNGRRGRKEKGRKGRKGSMGDVRGRIDFAPLDEILDAPLQF